MNHLSNFFYTSPKAASMTMTRRQVRETMLETGGWILACGHSWDIKAKSVGAGIYAVTLKEKVFK